MTGLEALTAKVMQACDDLACFTEVSGQINRDFLCPSAREAQAYLQAWAAHLGMTAQLDAVGNLRCRLESKKANAPTLYIGSHLDTVPNAGAYDGILGVVLGFALVEALQGRELPYAIEVMGFSEEEGVRFGVPFIGSRALVGTVSPLLEWRDPAGQSVREAISTFGLDADACPAALADANALGYFEIHIEQGPVLQDLGASVGVVQAIVGQNRVNLEFAGRASHAGTTPMHLRRDALAAAARFIVTCEDLARHTPGLVATVGMLDVKPGAGNVVPGWVACSLDLRHAQDDMRAEALTELLHQAQAFAEERQVTVTITPKMEERATPMSTPLRELLHQAAEDTNILHPELVSGAGHDAQIMAQKMPAAMLFVRSPNGLSHHPDEMVNMQDVQDALQVGMRFLELLAQQPAASFQPPAGGEK